MPGRRCVIEQLRQRRGQGKLVRGLRHPQILCGGAASRSCIAAAASEAGAATSCGHNLSGRLMKPGQVIGPSGENALSTPIVDNSVHSLLSCAETRRKTAIRETWPKKCHTVFVQRKQRVARETFMKHRRPVRFRDVSEVFLTAVYKAHPGLANRARV